MFKNTIKLLISNFSMVWKLLFFKFLAVAIVVGLFCTTLGYLNTLGSFSTLGTSILSFFNIANIGSDPSTILTSASTLFENLMAFFAELIATYPLIFVYILALIFVILPYLWHLSDLPANEEVFGFMSSQTKYGFTSSLIRNLNRANAYSWSHVLISLPLNAIFIAGVIGILQLGTLGGALTIVSPAMFFVWAILFYSLRVTTFSCWASAITTTNARTWAGLRKCLRAISRDFLRIWSNSIVFITIFALLAILTSLIGFAILLPLFCFVITVFCMVVFFEHRGMRYYVDFNTIVTPKKLEQTDKLSKLKHII